MNLTYQLFCQSLIIIVSNFFVNFILDKSFNFLFEYI